MHKLRDSHRELRMCFGRDELCTSILQSALQSGAVLVFGGRQAGKTTILRKIEDSFNEDRCSSDDLRQLVIPVYADLMTLPYDAAPRDFFRLLSTLALQACSRRIEGFELRSLPTEKQDT